MEKIKNGLRFRNPIRVTVLLVALCFASLSVQAGYAQLQPPSGWSQGGTAGNTFKVAANEAGWLVNGTVRTNAALNIGGRAIVVPAALRLAANAPTIAAAAMFGNPWTAALLLLAPIAVSWVAENGLFFDTQQNKWQVTEKQSSTKYYCGGPSSSTIMGSCTAMVDDWNAKYHNNPNGNNSFYWQKVRSCDNSGCLVEMRAGSLTGAVDDVQFRATSSDVAFGTTTRGVFDISEFQRLASLSPMPSKVANEIPANYPVEKPLLNPDANGVPQPLNVPNGNPIPIPNTNPQQYRVPQISIKPAVTSDPWTADVKTEEVITTDPNASAPNPQQPASTTTTDSDLCIKYPNILACSKPDLDTPSGDIPKTNKTITFTDQNPFAGGSCPADVFYTLSRGQSLKIWNWQKACSYALPIRAIIIALASFSAFLIVMPGETRV